MRRCLCVTLAVVVLLSVCTLAALVVWWTGRRLNVEEGAPAFHLVVTWSGAGTREWAVAAARACKRAGADACDEGTRAALTRVVSRDELKYSLRSLDTHLPWYAGAVTLLTDGSALPAWLDTGSPRLRVVTQDEIWTEGVARPSYSASALEAHLPHLFPVLNDAPGAPTTEHMVLVDGNHHVLGAWLGPRDFFWGPGAPVVRMYGEVARGWKREGSTYSAALALAASVLEDVDGATVRRQHVLGAPVALLESVLLDACIEWKEMCAATAARQFPARNDLPLVFMHNHLGVRRRGRGAVAISIAQPTCCAVQFHKQAVKDDRAGPAVFRFLATDVPVRRCRAVLRVATGCVCVCVCVCVFVCVPSAVAGAGHGEGVRDNGRHWTDTNVYLRRCGLVCALCVRARLRRSTPPPPPRSVSSAHGGLITRPAQATAGATSR